jgi:hypothetical protein
MGKLGSRQCVFVVFWLLNFLLNVWVLFKMKSRVLLDFWQGWLIGYLGFRILIFVVLASN